MRALVPIWLLSACAATCHSADNPEPYSREIETLRAADKANFDPRLRTLLLTILVPDVKQDIWMIKVAEFLQENPDKAYKVALEHLIPFPVQNRPTPYLKAQSALEQAWVAVASSGMNEDEKADALARAFAPGFHARVQNAAIKAIKQLKNGREALYRQILASEEQPIKPSDLLIIGELFGGVCEDANFSPTEDDLKKMIHSKVTFQKIFACRCLARKGDERANGIMLDLIKHDQFKQNGMRGALITELSYLPNKCECFVEMAKVVLREPKTREAGQFLWELVGRLGSIDKGTPKAPEAKAMLQEIANVELKVPDKFEHPDECLILYYYVEAKAAAKELLKGL
ncbi:MAG: hypothetical protein KIS92_15520 [Planctomycetota bacterium]|nr:hypothetical protein [Planctomycetota bacterium]